MYVENIVSQENGWHVEPLSLTVFSFSVLLSQNVSSITAQARQFPLRKPGGFHWDFFLLGCTTFVAGILGLPMPNGLVPQVSTRKGALTKLKKKRNGLLNW